MAYTKARTPKARMPTPRSKRTGGKSRAPAAPHSQQGRETQAPKATAPAGKAPMIAAPVQLNELGKAISRIDLSPLSAMGPHIVRAESGACRAPLSKTATLSAVTPPTMLTSVETLGAMVRARREALQLSQQSFAERAGVGRRFVSELENGKPSLEFDKVLAVAQAAGIDLLAAPKSPP